jgi:hypothetical protein
MSNIGLIKSSALTLRAKPEFNEYIKSLMTQLKMFGDPSKLVDINQNNISTNSSVFLTRPLLGQDDIVSYVQDHAKKILELELMTWSPVNIKNKENEINTHSAEKMLDWFEMDVHPFVYSVMPISEDKLRGEALSLHAWSLKPREPFIKWLRENNAYFDRPVEDASIYDLAVLQSTCPLIISEPLNEKNEIDEFIKVNASNFAETSFAYWCSDQKYWKLNECVRDFNKWFDTSLHLYAFHLAN